MTGPHVGRIVPGRRHRPLTNEADQQHDPRMDDDLDPREIARDKRRDHDAEAARRALMRPGMGKVFKQIMDRWAEETPPDQRRAHKRAGRGDGGPR